MLVCSRQKVESERSERRYFITLAKWRQGTRKVKIIPLVCVTLPPRLIVVVDFSKSIRALISECAVIGRAEEQKIRVWQFSALMINKVKKTFRTPLFCN